MNEGILKKTISCLPPKPGVYFFKDNRGKALYAGKALNLKNRVLSYLKTKDVRLKKMLEKARSLSYKTTDSEIEALISESQFIKKLKPKYNIVLRDDKQYFFVGFTQEKFPHIFIGHQSTPATSNTRQATSIGPFTDGTALKTSLRFLRNIFPHCTCKQKHNLPCLNYHIGNCLGVCCLKQLAVSAQFQDTKFNIQTPKIYQNNIKAIKDILTGKRTSLVKNLETEMKKLAKEEKLEQAIELRNKLKKLKRVFENAQIIAKLKTNSFPTLSRIHDKIETKPKESKTLKQLAEILNIKTLIIRIEGYDISNIQGANAVGSMVVFTDGQPNKNEYRKFKIRSKNTPNDTAMLSEIIQRRFKHSEWRFPDLIVVDGGKNQLNAVIKTINNQRLTIPIIALTKNEKHLGHKIIMTNNKEIPLSHLPPQVKNLLLNIDGEAHRFAVSYHRRLRSKNIQYSYASKQSP